MFWRYINESDSAQFSECVYHPCEELLSDRRQSKSGFLANAFCSLPPRLQRLALRMNEVSFALRTDVGAGLESLLFKLVYVVFCSLYHRQVYQ